MRHTQLRSFHAVARLGSFTAAAHALRVSQPTITNQVKALEQSYGIDLFLRHGRRIELTQDGRDLMAMTHRLFADEDEIQQFLSDRKGLKGGYLRVGAVGPYHVTEMLAAFNSRYPNLMVSVTVGNSHEVVRGLLDYRTDVAVLAEIEPHHQLLTIPYNQHPVIVFVGREHRFCGRKEIRIRELEGERMIVREPGSTTRRAFERALQQARVKPKTVMEIGSREAIREAVARGIGISVVSEAAFAPDPRLWPVHVSDANILTYANIACLKDRQNARLIRAFLEVVRTGLKRSEQTPPTIGMQH